MFRIPRRTKRSAYGFSLVELMVVVAILTLLLSIVYAATTRSIKAAHRTVCLSNLRQCGHALMIYQVDWGQIPTGSAVYGALAHAPTCDPEDNWRTNCSSPVTPPRVGSYGYVRLCPEYSSDSDWQEALSTARPPLLMVSIFYGERHVTPFVGMLPDQGVCVRNAWAGCVALDRVVALAVDGSARSFNTKEPAPEIGRSFHGFYWPATFLENQNER